MASLERLILEHEATLVLQPDESKAFDSTAVPRPCAQHGITWMRRLIRRPRFPDVCEVGGCCAKVRAMAAARARGAGGSLCPSNLDQAMHRSGRSIA